MASKLGDLIVNLLFPKRCPWCDSVLGFQRSCACLEGIDALWLPDAELPAPRLDDPWRIERVWACFHYEEPVRAAILRMKFENGRNLAVPMGERLFEKYAACGIAGHVNSIVPVPVSPETARLRGYNQSALVAWELARYSGLPCLPRALQKVRETIPQSELDRAGRLTNVAGAYLADPEDVAGKDVLLVDDILTTGSTLNECAKTVLEAGAGSCHALCIAASQVQLPAV